MKSKQHVCQLQSSIKHFNYLRIRRIRHQLSHWQPEEVKLRFSFFIRSHWDWNKQKLVFRERSMIENFRDWQLWCLISADLEARMFLWLEIMTLSLFQIWTQPWLNIQWQNFYICLKKCVLVLKSRVLQRILVANRVHWQSFGGFQQGLRESNILYCNPRF